MDCMKASKPPAGRFGSPNTTSSPGFNTFTCPGPISYSFSSVLIPSGGSPPSPSLTSLKGIELVSASVLIKAVKKLSTTAAMSSLSV